ncbi:conserved hypothetical protein [Neospora caninum Liverpool]|uniref:Uncharacterized protein n=1 Tax=Neospora caninum (strain Liverpool) TaxID=572307 RepID=F0VFM5_NEOCL|nr:conserved hypothetical protein [Neospora caninum Liverpool]CBZ52519.1 conserved hypothetical protein [Neospora caninum Liverpool]CEL66496.1 TPA: hypothetical protein BN1204_023070 [Neospora caninum Liverpool]|eukprot:XP_003882551.1 conserved hypothetical protein [Neospora caninum Liverpool]
MKVRLACFSFTGLLVGSHGASISLFSLPGPAWTTDTEPMNIRLVSASNPQTEGLRLAEPLVGGSILPPQASDEHQQLEEIHLPGSRNDFVAQDGQKDGRVCTGKRIRDTLSGSFECTAEGGQTQELPYDFSSSARHVEVTYNEASFVDSAQLHEDESASRWTGVDQALAPRKHSLKSFSPGRGDEPLDLLQDPAEFSDDPEERTSFKEQVDASAVFPFTANARLLLPPGDTGSVSSEKRQLEEPSASESARSLREESGRDYGVDTGSSEGSSSSPEEDETSSAPKEVMGLADMMAAGRQRRQAVEALSMMGFQMPPGGLAAMSPQQQQMMAMFLMQQQVQSLQGFAGQPPLGSEQQLAQPFLSGQQQGQLMQEMMRGNQSSGRGGRANRNSQGNSIWGASQRGGRQRQNGPSIGVAPGQMAMPSAGYPPGSLAANGMYAPPSTYSSHMPYTYYPFSPAAMANPTPSAPGARGPAPPSSVPRVSSLFPSQPEVNTGTLAATYGYGNGVNNAAYASTVMPPVGGGSAPGVFAANQGNSGLGFAAYTGGNAAASPSPYDPNLQQRPSQNVEAARWAEQLRRQQDAWARQNA